MMFAVLAAVVFQACSLYSGAMFYHEAGLWHPNRKRRNRWGFVCLVTSVMALLSVGVA